MKWALGWVYRVPRGQGVGIQGPRGSRGRPTGSQGVTGVGLQGLRGSRADMIFVQLFTQPDFQAKICTPLKCVMAKVQNTLVNSRGD